jgi:formylglycine-generating enzyme required for sulfatase activity
MKIWVKFIMVGIGLYLALSAVAQSNIDCLGEKDILGERFVDFKYQDYDSKCLRYIDGFETVDAMVKLYKTCPDLDKGTGKRVQFKKQFYKLKKLKDQNCKEHYAQINKNLAIKRANFSKNLAKYAPAMTLINIPAGSFRMGDISGAGYSSEKPVHQVRLKGFKMMKHEVTFAQYDLYAESAGKDKPDDEGWGRGKRPVINVSWNDATAYAQWLSQKTGMTFRLPSESQWEYAVRAGTSTKYPWGNSASHDKANYGEDECCGGLATGSDRWVNTAPVGSFPANQFGLKDMHGNVWEWIQDCWNDPYNGAPQDGSGWMSGGCNVHVLRGGSWLSEPSHLRSANRYWNSPGGRLNDIGFRLIQDP